MKSINRALCLFRLMLDRKVTAKATGSLRGGESNDRSNGQGDLRHHDLGRRVLGRTQDRPFGDDGGDGWGDELHAWMFDTPDENRA